MSSHVTLYCVILHFIAFFILCPTLLSHCIILNCIIAYHSIAWCIVLCHIVSRYIVLCIILYLQLLSSLLFVIVLCYILNCCSSRANIFKYLPHIFAYLNVVICLVLYKAQKFHVRLKLSELFKAATAWPESVIQLLSQRKQTLKMSMDATWAVFCQQVYVLQTTERRVSLHVLKVLWRPK